MTSRKNAGKSIALLLLATAFFNASAQETLPDYYYKNIPPRAAKGLSVDVSPLTAINGKLNNLYKPTYIDASLAYFAGVIIDNYKAVFEPEFSFFFNFALHTPRVDTNIVAIREQGRLVDYKNVSLTNLQQIRGGLLATLWVKSKTKWQAGPLLGVSVGRYGFSVSEGTKDTTQTFNVKREFIAFSPGVGIRCRVTDKFGLHLQLSYQLIFETAKANPVITAITPDLTGRIGTFTPRIGFFYNFKTR